jgi:hypothetical protein
MSKLIVNCVTGETIERGLNKAEQDQQQVDEAKAAELAAELQAEAETKATAKQAILDRLGLTAEEAALLLS